MRFLAILLVLVPLGAGAVTVEDLMKEIERRDLEIREMKKRDLENERKLAALTAVVSQLQHQLNDTEELEARVTVLEVSMVDVEEDVVILQNGFVALTDEVDDIESDNTIQDDRLNTMEAEILDNDNDIEVLVGDIDTLEDATGGLQIRVTDLEGDVVALDQRVGDLESGGGGSNNTDLTERVEMLEEVTSQMSGDISELVAENVVQDEQIAGLDEDVAGLDQRVEDLESGSGGNNVTGYEDISFLATFDEYSLTPTDPLVFNVAVFNDGGHYDVTTGIYTVPIDGEYEFTFQIWAYQDYQMWAHLMVDDVRVAFGYKYGGDDYPEIDTTILLRLTTGQQVWVEPSSIEEIHGANDGSGIYSWFSGHLVNAL